jgi:hypothetical protein
VRTVALYLALRDLSLVEPNSRPLLHEIASAAADALGTPLSTSPITLDTEPACRQLTVSLFARFAVGSRAPFLLAVLFASHIQRAEGRMSPEEWYLLCAGSLGVRSLPGLVVPASAGLLNSAMLADLSNCINGLPAHIAVHPEKWRAALLGAAPPPPVALGDTTWTPIRTAVVARCLAPQHLRSAVASIVVDQLGTVVIRSVAVSLMRVVRRRVCGAADAVAV